MLLINGSGNDMGFIILFKFLKLMYIWFDLFFFFIIIKGND